MAIGGPLVTLAIALACFGIGIAAAGSDEFWRGDAVDEGPTLPGSWPWSPGWPASTLLVLVFNLIPAFPLDGGRIARAIAWRVTGDRNRATRAAGRLGQGFSYLFIGVGILLFFQGDVIGGIWLALIGFILGQSARGAACRPSSPAGSRASGSRT